MAAIADAAAAADHPAAPDDERVYLVPYRWWRGAQESVAAVDGLRGIPYAATPVTTSYEMKIISMFSSDLVFNLRRSEDLSLGDADEGVSGQSFALIPSEVWLQAFKCSVETFDEWFQISGENDQQEVIQQLHKASDETLHLVLKTLQAAVKAESSAEEILSMERDEAAILLICQKILP